MSLDRTRNWGGDRVGTIWIANEPLKDRMGHCILESDEATLTNGFRVSGVGGRHIGDFLPIGTVAVAVRHAGDFYNEYVPITRSEDGNNLIPFIDLRFGAYAYGEYVGQMDRQGVALAAAGLAIEISSPGIRIPSSSRAVHLP